MKSKEIVLKKAVIKTEKIRKELISARLELKKLSAKKRILLIQIARLTKLAEAMEREIN
jgi:hypothetical protein